MRKRSIVLVASLVMSLLVFLPAAPANHDPNGAHAADPAGDAMSRVFPNYRNSYAQEDPTLLQDSLDLKSASLQTSLEGTERFLTLTAETWGNLPMPGADALGPNGFEPGITNIDIYFTWATNQNQAGNSMTAPQPTGLTCGDAYTEQRLDPATLLRIDYDTHNDSGNVNGCRFATQGPWHPIDGWALAILLSADTVAGKVQYSWSWARYDAIEGIHWTRPGSAHDRVECASLNPIAFTCQTPAFGTGPDEVLNLTPATLNGNSYNKDGSLRTGTGWSSATNSISLKIPYLMRDDFAADNNGKADEMRVNTIMSPNDQVTGFTVALGAAASVNIPPGPCIAYGAMIYEADPTLHDNDLVTKDECFSYSAGVTFTSDWVPGNPFVDTSGALEGVPGAFGKVCIGTTCRPNWGGNIIGTGLGTAVGNYHPGLGAPFCRYPVGLAFGGGSVPSGVTTRTVDDPAQGGTVRIYKADESSDYLVSQHYDGVNTNFDGGDPGVAVGFPTGGNNPCGHTRDSQSGGWIHVGTGTSFTAR